MAAQVGAAGPSAAGTNTVVLTPALISEWSQALLTNSPVIMAARQRVRAAVEGVNSVRTWEDPTVKAGIIPAREELRASDGDIIYGVDQKLPLFGKAKLARDVARAGTGAAEANVDYQFQNRRADFTRHLLSSALNNRLTAIGEQDSQWLETLSATLQQRNEAGQASAVDLLKLESERARRIERLRTDTANRDHEFMAMNLMLKRDVGAQWPALDLPPVAPLVLTHQLESQALIYERKLAEMRQVVKQSEASVELARRQRLPDVSMGLEARNYSGNGSFRQGTLLLGMSLPWVNKSRYQSDVAREDAKLEAARLDTTEYEFSIREELHRLSTAVDVARRQALLYRDGIIPRTTATLSTIQASWSTGRATLTEVLEARRLLLEGQIAYAQAITDQYSALADLVKVCDLSGIDKLLELTTAPSPSKPPGS